MECDVTDSKAVAALFKKIGEKFGRLDILANNAGTSQPKDIFEITRPRDWDRIIKTNLTSGFYCARQAMLMMRGQKFGRIVFTSSVVRDRGALFGHVHYAATKAGQMGMVKTLARTGAPYGITVNAVAPGIVDTELLHKTHGDDGRGGAGENHTAWARERLRHRQRGRLFVFRRGALHHGSYARRKRGNVFQIA